VCPPRLNNQQLQVVMTATVHHMPLVLQLYTNTSAITLEIKTFRTVVQKYVQKLHASMEILLTTLLKGTRRVPEFEVYIMDDVRMPARRSKSAMRAVPKSRTEIHRNIDQFSGIEQHHNSRLLDALVLESPLHSHAAVAPPDVMIRRVLRGTLSSRFLTKPLSDINLQMHKWDEFKKIKTIFDEADLDRSGSIDMHEFMLMYFNKGLSLLDKHVRFKTLDVNKDGKLSWQELKAIMDPLCKLPDGMSLFDQDESGSVDFEEFMKLYSNTGRSRLDMKAIFEKLDIDQTGTVDKNELGKIMVKDLPPDAQVNLKRESFSKAKRRSSTTSLQTQSRSNIFQRNNQVLLRLNEKHLVFKTYCITCSCNFMSELDMRFVMSMRSWQFNSKFKILTLVVRPCHRKRIN